MNSLNSIILEGNVVRTPQIQETTKGTPFCKIGVAVNRWYKSMNGSVQNEVSFFDIDAWGALAKTCSETCEKGRGVRVVGRLKQDRWQDQATGKNRSRVTIVAEHIEFKPKFAATPAGISDEQRINELRDVQQGAAAAYAEQACANF
jgi:single-strand DNA-binding protein